MEKSEPQQKYALNLNWLVVEPPTHLKNMRKSNWKSSPNSGENKKYLKPVKFVCIFHGGGLFLYHGIPNP